MIRKNIFIGKKIGLKMGNCHIWKVREVMVQWIQNLMKMKVGQVRDQQAVRVEAAKGMH